MNNNLFMSKTMCPEDCVDDRRVWVDSCKTTWSLSEDRLQIECLLSIYYLLHQTGFHW